MIYVKISAFINIAQFNFTTGTIVTSIKIYIRENEQKRKLKEEIQPNDETGFKINQKDEILTEYLSLEKKLILVQFRILRSGTKHFGIHFDTG